MKYKLLLLTMLSLLAYCGPSDEEIQNQIDKAVEEAVVTSTTTQPTTTTTTTTTQPTTTTIYDSTCVDYANELINIWPGISDAVGNIFDVYSLISNGNLSYSDGANKLFENNLEWNKSIREFKSLNPNEENKKFHNTMLDVFDYISESNEFGIQALDEIDVDLLERALSLAEIGFDTLGEAIELLPMGTIYGLRDAC